MTSSTHPKHLSPTLYERSADRLRGLCDATGLHDDAGQITDLFRRLMAPWGDEPVNPAPLWPSLVGDDATPFEFSLGLGASPELRIMVEPLGAIPTLRSNQEAAEALLNSLAGQFDIDMGRFEKIRDLFLPAHSSGSFAIWVAVGFSAGHSPAFKIYLDPEAQGRGQAPQLVHEALVRLGFSAASKMISNTLAPRGADCDELKYLSLDLSPSPQARVKIYARHQECTVRVLESAASASPWNRRGEVARFLKIVAPQAGRLFKGRSPITCYAFVQGNSEVPSSVTTHFPINGYAANDGVIRQRVVACLDWLKLPTDAYVRAMQAFATRPLDSGIGLQSYVSFKRDKGQPQLTLYLPAEIYAPGTVAKPAARENSSALISTKSQRTRS